MAERSWRRRSFQYRHGPLTGALPRAAPQRPHFQVPGGLDLTQEPGDTSRSAAPTPSGLSAGPPCTHSPWGPGGRGCPPEAPRPSPSVGPTWRLDLPKGRPCVSHTAAPCTGPLGPRRPAAPGHAPRPRLPPRCRRRCLWATCGKARRDGERLLSPPAPSHRGWREGAARTRRARPGRCRQWLEAASLDATC